MDKLLYVHRVAEVLDCSKPMVYKLIYEGKLKAVRLGERGIRVSETSLQDFLDYNQMNPSDFSQYANKKNTP